MGISRRFLCFSSITNENNTLLRSQVFWGFFASGKTGAWKYIFKDTFFCLSLQALLMKEYSLSIILLTRSLMEASNHTSHGENVELSNGEGADHKPSSDPMICAREIVFAMVNIMAHSHHFPCALAKCIMPAVERSVIVVIHSAIK
jgi:hypothetical protein